MGFGTNDDSAMWLEPFDDMTGPMDNTSGGFLVPESEMTALQKVHTAMRDEQLMADVFSECALAIEAMRLAQETLNLGAGASFETRNKVADVVGRAADHLESAVAAANGGAA